MQRIACIAVLLNLALLGIISIATSAATLFAATAGAASIQELEKEKEKKKETPKDESPKDESPKDDSPKETPDSPQAAVVKEMLGVMDKLTTALSGIKDTATAEAAKPELRKLAKAWTAVRDKAEKTPPPSKEEKARLEKDFKSQMEIAQRKLFGEVGRVRNIPGAGDALQEIRSVLTRTMK